MRQKSCKTGQKVQSTVICEKLVVTAMHVMSPANCSKQQQPPGRLDRSPMEARMVRGAQYLELALHVSKTTKYCWLLVSEQFLVIQPWLTTAQHGN